MLRKLFLQAGRFNGLLFIAMFLLLVVQRWMVLDQFAFQHTDADQVVMWHGVVDYASGQFHEPRFYGQDYNAMIESLLAVPLFKMGMSVNYALPLVTALLTVFPYLFLSLLFCRHRAPFFAILTIAVPLMLAPEYVMITSMPRGFVTGIAVSAIGMIGLFFQNSVRWCFVSGITIVLGMSINPNAAPLGLLILVLLFFQHGANRSFYMYTLTGVVCAAAIHFIVSCFYKTHPFVALMGINTEYRPGNIPEGLVHADDFLNTVMPVFSKSGYLLFFLFFIPAYLLYRKGFRFRAFIVSLIPCCLLVTFGLNKIHDGTTSVFYPLSRMYLALPVVFVASFFLLKNMPVSRKWYALFLLPVTGFLKQCTDLSQIITENTIPQKKTVISIAPVERVTSDCRKILQCCKNNGVELVLIPDHWNAPFYAYGCKACADAFPKTLYPIYERRHWRLLEDENKVYRTILILDTSRDFSKAYPSVEKVPGQPFFYLLRNNSIATMMLLQELNITCRKYQAETDEVVPPEITIPRLSRW